MKDVMIPGEGVPPPLMLISNARSGQSVRCDICLLCNEKLKTRTGRSVASIIPSMEKVSPDLMMGVMRTGGGDSEYHEVALECRA